MGILRRIRDLISMFFSMFVDSAESGVPLERRLAYDRAKRAENLKKQMGAATDVGQAAEMMVQQLAEARLVAANVRQQAKNHLLAAGAAQARGDAATQMAEEAQATTLANELAEAEADVASLEKMVEDALSDKKEAIVMVLDQAKELEKLARGDSRFVARTRMTEMRQQQLALREQMLDLVPGDRENIRARIQDQVVKDETRFKARKDVVDAMWEQKQSGRMADQLQSTAAGAVKLEELKRELGMSAPPVAAPAAVPAAVPDLKEAEQVIASESGGGGGSGVG